MRALPGPPRGSPHGIPAAAPATGGLSLFGGLFSFLGFNRGGIVASAAGGWALPSFPGAQPALLHQREMVLPAHISDGIQNAIAGGGFGGGGISFNLRA